MSDAANTVLTTEERDALRALVQRDGTHVVAARWGCGREVILRALAGLPARVGSVLLIRVRLESTDRAA